eukprot:NODE_6721_length_542_cov_154.876268_g6299_i0.p2 GENE.NODE_6721_length_542_cov_154.876268_g6299_i0~~NODE_6721_length_542_cov_154.876268_g6299_i0.p2  ORF type:complete len:157 (-),score=41.74 NODE_6721_length_542_cov_154.876268_g6299_i0:70-492(-)
MARPKKIYTKKGDGKVHEKKPKSKKPNVRLFQPGVMLGYRRAKKSTNPHHSLIAIKGVTSRKDTRFYMGKRCLYLFKATKKVAGPKCRQQPHLKSNVRRIWGRIRAPHGKSGVVKAVFKPNLPGQAMGKKIRVYLYPSSI